MKYTLFTLLFLVGCSPTWYLKHNPEICDLCTEKDSSSLLVTVTERDTAFFQDPILFSAFLSCDSNYQVVLNSSAIERINADKVSTELRGNLLKLRFALDSCRGKVIIKYRDRFTERTVREPLNTTLQTDNDNLRKSLKSAELSLQKSKKTSRNSIILNALLLSLIGFVIYKKNRK